MAESQTEVRFSGGGTEEAAVFLIEPGNRQIGWGDDGSLGPVPGAGSEVYADVLLGPGGESWDVAAAEAGGELSAG